MNKLLLALLVCSLCGCANAMLSGSGPRGPELRLQERTYAAADQLHGQLGGSGVAAYPMLAAAFVDAATMQSTSDLGRLLSEQVASRLSQRGYSIAEIQLRSDQLAIRPDAGVFALSREVAEINADVAAYSILVGTYTLIERHVYVNARVLRASDGVALASVDFSLPAVVQHAAGSPGSAAQPSVGTRLN